MLSLRSGFVQSCNQHGRNFRYASIAPVIASVRRVADQETEKDNAWIKITIMPTIAWSDYMKYRARLRGFSLEKIEEILRYSSERYFDSVTHRMVVVGKHDNCLVIIPYDEDGDPIVPVTIHAITRQQIKFRLKSGRFTK